jgi:hypothetical protein
MKFKTHQHYILKDGSEVCGATTIIGQINKPQLLMWVYRLASEKIKFWEVTNRSKNIGTIAHYLIECYCKGDEPNQDFLDDYSKKENKFAENSFQLFKLWLEMHDVIIVNTELQMVSETYKYGGTPDIIAYVDKVLTILDIKTGSGVYPEVKYQLSAYKQLYNEKFNADLQQCIVIHIPYEKHNFTEYIFKKDELTVAFEGFIHLLRFHEINKKVVKQ